MRRWQRGLLVGLAVVLGLILAIESLVGFAYFFVPVVVIGLIAVVAYLVLAHARARNPLVYPKHGPAENYADGQPLGRFDLHEQERKHTAEEERELAEEERERRRREHAGEPPGEVGPPPHVPFP